MSHLIKSLSDTEIKEYTEKGKGIPKYLCAYYLSLCFRGYDSGTCDYIYQQCLGYKPPGGGGGGCGYCTCR